MERCCCPSLADLAVVPMGGDGLDERVFATLENIRDHGGELWWLYLSKCSACGQDWLVAQDERIYDNFYLKRLSPTEARTIADDNRWPDAFITYERVLRLGRTLSQPWTFLDLKRHRRQSRQTRVLPRMPRRMTSASYRTSYATECPFSTHCRH